MFIVWEKNKMGCSNGACELAEQQNIVTLRNYKLKCSECDFETSQPNKDTVLCPKCNEGILYWTYTPQDGLTDHQRRMICRFYGNLTDTKVVLNLEP